MNKYYWQLHRIVHCIMANKQVFFSISCFERNVGGSHFSFPQYQLKKLYYAPLQYSFSNTRECHHRDRMPIGAATTRNASKASTNGAAIIVTRDVCPECHV